MRPLSLLSIALAAALPLAGCLGGGDVPAATSAQPEPLSNGAGLANDLEDALSLAELLAQDPANATVAAPVWSVGDAWSFATQQADGAGEPVTLAVTASNGQSYTLLPTGEDMAVYDALFDVSYVGPIRATDLAGAQDGTPVRFFDFPLKDGKSWSTTWDGLTITLTAKANPAISTPMGTQAGFDIVATREGGEVHATYDFVPALKWWSHIEFSAGYGLRLESFTANWTGSVLRGTANEVFNLAPVGPVTNMPGAAFSVAEGQSALAIVMMGHTEKQARAVLVTDPSHMPVFLEGGDDVLVDPAPRREFRVDTIMQPAPGQWHIGFAMLHDPHGMFHVMGHEIALEPVTLA